MQKQTVPCTTLELSNICCFLRYVIRREREREREKEREREDGCLALLPSMCIFITMQLIGLQCANVAFPGHTPFLLFVNLLFILNSSLRKKYDLIS